MSCWRGWQGPIEDIKGKVRNTFPFVTLIPFKGKGIYFYFTTTLAQELQNERHTVSCFTTNLGEVAEMESARVRLGPGKAMVRK